MERIEQKSMESLHPACGNIGSFDPDKSFHLREIRAGQILDLRQQNAFTFKHSDGKDAKCFNVIFEEAVGIGKAETDQLWISGHTLYISVTDYAGKAAQLSIYNLTGQLIMQKQMSVGQLSTIDLSSINTATVIVRLIVDGKVLTTKGVLPQ